MPAIKRLALLVTLIALAACSALPGNPSAQNRQKWESQHITHYRINLSIGCFCVFSARMPVSVEIDNGKVLSIIDNQGKPADDLQDAVAPYAGIDKLFDEIDAAHKAGAAQVDVTYNAQYGYPETINIDQSQQVADDELSLSITHFEVLP